MKPYSGYIIVKEIGKPTLAASNKTVTGEVLAVSEETPNYIKEGTKVLLDNWSQKVPLTELGNDVFLFRLINILTYQSQLPTVEARGLG